MLLGGESVVDIDARRDKPPGQNPPGIPCRLSLLLLGEFPNQNALGGLQVRSVGMSATLC